MRNLVSIRTIDNIRPIEGADAIECATIGGWDVVVKKDEFEVGDLCVYFEIDSFLPLSDERYKFLSGSRDRKMDGVVGHALKTVRLRGQLSQGLALPLQQFPELVSFSEGDDVSEVLGIVKWEKPVPQDLSGTAAGMFPTSLVRKTDSERAQNLTSFWGMLRTHDWYATEKVDGTSITIINDDGTPRVCSRNLELVENYDNFYWANAKEFVLGKLQPGFYVQGELYGPGIQDNRLGVSEVRLAAFAYGQIGKDPLPWVFWPHWLTSLAAPMYDELSGTLPDTVEDAVNMVDGIKSLVSPGRLAEGVVFHSVSGYVYKELGYRSNFKVISNKYLLKGKD